MHATQDALQGQIAAQATQEEMILQPKQQLPARSSIASPPAHVKPGHVQQVTTSLWVSWLACIGYGFKWVVSVAAIEAQ